MTAREAKTLKHVLRAFSARLRTTKNGDGRTSEICIRNVAHEMDEQARKLEIMEKNGGGELPSTF